MKKQQGIKEITLLINWHLQLENLDAASRIWNDKQFCFAQALKQFFSKYLLGRGLSLFNNKDNNKSSCN